MANPLAPLLTSPRSLQHMASGGTIRLTWKYQHPEAGKTQAKVAVRRKALPSGSLEYWNGTTWVGSETYVVCTTEFIDINAGWVAGTKYQWTLRVQDSAVANGPYASDQIFICIAAPVANVLQPTGTPAVSRPTVTWEYSQAQGYQQLRYRVAVYTAAVYGLGGFAPFDTTGAYPAHWTQDWVTSSIAWSAVIGNDVVSGTTYKAYVQVETEGGLQSAVGATAAWTPSLTLPASPTITAVADNALGAYKIDVTAQLNLISNAGSSFEDGTVGEWLELIGCTLAASTDFASHGTRSLKVTSRSATYAFMDTTYTTYTAHQTALATYTATIAVLQEANSMRIQTTPGNAGTIAVSVGAVYSAVAQVRKATGSANAVMRIAWYTAAGAFISYSSTATVSANATGWTTLALNSQTAPATAAFAALEVQFVVAAINEVFYIDQIAFANAANAVWAPGSGTSASFIIERSDDNGVTWAPIQGYSRYGAGASHHPVQALISDYDRTAKQGWPNFPQYRAYTVTSGGVVSAVGQVTAGAYLLGTSWWLRDPLEPTRDMKIAQMEFAGKFDVAAEQFMAEGRTEAVVITANTPMSDQFDVSIWIQTDDDFDKVVRLIKSKRTLFVQGGTHGLGWYIRFAGTVSYEQVIARGNGVWTVNKPLYRFTAPAVQVGRMYTKANPNTATGVVTYTEVVPT